MDDRELRRRLGEVVEDGAAVERLARYVRLLETWAPRHSLVRFASTAELLERHVLEALVALPRLSGEGILVDVGSGAGLPGLPLLACRPAWRGVLVEPRQKRWAFLKQAIRVLGLDAEVERCRFEDLELTGVDVITVRALTVDADLLAWARASLAGGGRLLVWGTVEVEQRLAAQPGWRVLSFAFATLDRGRLIDMEPCFT